jgi:hypothetical protein
MEKNGMISIIVQMVVLALIILIVAGKSRSLGIDEGRETMYNELKNSNRLKELPHDEG